MRVSDKIEQRAHQIENDEAVQSKLKIKGKDLIEIELIRRNPKPLSSEFIHEKLNTREFSCGRLDVALAGKVVSVEKSSLENPLHELIEVGKFEPLSAESQDIQKSSKKKINRRLLEMHTNEIMYCDFKASSNGCGGIKNLNYDEVIEIFQFEAGFTIATDKKPMLATFGCGPCVALCGYEETNKIAFVVHFSTTKELIKYGGVIFHNIAKLAKQKIEKPIQLHLRGGIKGVSEDRIEAVKKWMKLRDDLPMEIVSEDILNDHGCIKSILIDSRTGEVTNYDSPKKEIDELRILSLANDVYDPVIRVTYTPKLQS